MSMDEPKLVEDPANPTPPPKKKFYIYSSKAAKGDDFFEEKDSNTDRFLSFLPSKYIILEDTPQPSAKLDDADEWATWLKRFDDAGEFTVHIADTPIKRIERFTFKFTFSFLEDSPSIIFSSSPDALATSFGLNNGIPTPGIAKKGDLLYAGLDLKATTKPLITTVKKVFEYIGEPWAAKALPEALSSLTLILDMSESLEKHNALWFNPEFFSQTTMRLQFRINALDRIKEMLESHLEGLKIIEAAVICKKVLVATETVSGPSASDQGEATFSFRCQLKVPNRSLLKLSACANFLFDSLSITFQPESQDDIFTTMLLWLGQLAKIDLKGVEQVLGKDDLFKNVYFREVTVNLALDEKGRPTGVNSFGMSIEVSATIGKGAGLGEEHPVFLLTYHWEKGASQLGTLEGQLWNWFDQTGYHKGSPYYEWWKDLQPMTLAPAKSIDLVSLIPGERIQNVPDFIPTDITRASISLSDTSFAVGGIIAAAKPEGRLPHPTLGLVQLDISYTWSPVKDFSVELAIMADLIPNSDKATPSTLMGQLEYHSLEKTWVLQASLEALYASSLYSFFDNNSAENVTPLIESIQVQDLTVKYQYAGKGSGNSRSSGSSFGITGALLIAGLELDLKFHYSNDWSFEASLGPQDAKATVGQVVAGILGDDQLDLPDFIADIQFSKGSTLDLKIKKEKPEKNQVTETGKTGNEPRSTGSFHFIARISIAGLEFVFAQYRSANWETKARSKRFIKVALQGLEIPDMKLIGKMELPFYEMGFIWIQDPVTKKGLSGLTRKEVTNLNESLPVDHQLVYKDKFKENEKKDDNVLFTAGSHFCVITKDASGTLNCALDYAFKGRSKKKQVPSKPATLTFLAEKEEAEDAADDGKTAQAPFKKKAGPLSLKNIGLKYANKQVYILFDATFDLGPLEFSLLGFSIGLEIFKLNEKLEVHTPTIEGFSIGFQKRPLTIGGIIRHGKKPGLEYYAGGLIVGFIPYEFIAAGFYGNATDGNGQQFISMFLFAKLNGPLFSLGFADISGVTGGFGYNSEVRTPAPDQVVNFPFVASDQLEGKNPLETLEALTSQGDDGWFHPKDKTYWAAAGMKISAFQMISMDAVVVVQFGQAIKLGVFAVAIADVPSSKAKLKFAHVELGLAVVVDFDYGTMKVEGQLSPNSYVLHPDCHLTGGFGLYYWFDGPHADKSVVGEFVFTIGGYHQAFDVPAGYPRPPRLGISWSYSSKLSITGEAYFAITPKACMGGGRLHASFSAGPIEAWFDALADFLINYRPFTFIATMSISVGVKCSIDVLFVHKSVSAEVGASLTLWGPPVAGKVHVDFWVTSFDINFGGPQVKARKISLIEFYELVLQSGDTPQNLASLPATEESAPPIERPVNQGHTFLALSGLVNAGDDTKKKSTDPWTVRGGTFSFSVSCKMAVQSVSQGGKTITHENDIYSKPMHLVTPMSSNLSVWILQEGATDVSWRMEKQEQSVPTALWDKYSEATDPSNGRNHISSLLDTKDSTVSLMMGVLFNVPPPILSLDKLPAAGTADKNIEEIPAEKQFPPVTSSNGRWEPAPHPAGEDDQKWKSVHDTWNNPSLGKGGEGQAGFVSLLAEALNWDNTDSRLSKLAGLPKRMNERFDDLFIAAPLISKG